MNKTLKFACLSAVALAGFGFTACSSSDEVETNPNYNPVTGTVNANFVFNVATGNTPQSRQTAANTQADISQNFRGIESASLFAYKLGAPANDGKHVFNPGSESGKQANTATAAHTFNLGKILAAGELDPDGAPKSRRVLELALPVETNTLMFWGKAPQTGEDANNAQGKISFAASKADITQHAFSLTPRVASGSDGATALSHYQTLVTTLLNAVVQTRYQAAAGGCKWSTEVGGDGTTNADAIDLYWSDFVTVDPTTGAMSVKSTDVLDPSLPMCALGEILGDAFASFNTVYSAETRAGSGSAVHRMMSDLYTVINKVASATPVSYQEYVAKQVATNIQENILKIVDAAGNIKTIAVLKSNAGVTFADVDAELTKFPDEVSSIGLPKGAAQLEVTINKTAGAYPVATWSYAANVKSGIAGATHSIYNYMYPAELCYFGNSPVRVTNDTHQTTDYPDGSDNWDLDAQWTTNVQAGWTKNSHVKSTTRSVAMQENINYGTSLLKTSVAFKSGVSQLQDNNAAIQAMPEHGGATEENNKFDVSSSLFTLTGILVGGQPQTVGWNYLPKANTFNYVVYDKNIVSAAVPTATDQETYTLVWDNYDSSLGTTQAEVMVALEFTNNTGKDFWGATNLVRNGGTFYLVGKLNPAATGLNAITWPTHYALPPYNTTTGATEEITRVFIQDYMTTAKFVIDETSLQHAYVTVPDLRSTQISLGLSVDLSWQTGLTFEEVVLGQ